MAKELAVGQRLRTNHDCGDGRTLTLRRDEQGYHAFCFRCNLPGWSAPLPEPLSVRLERLRNQNAADAKALDRTDLPTPMVRVWAEWPLKARLWFIKAGLTSADMGVMQAYYHPPTERVVLPVLMPSRGVVFWQARALDGRVPKYLAPDIPKAQVVARYGAADVVTLTEDLLSAYKVGTVGEGWSLLGTSISPTYLSLLIGRGCKVNVWLDPDAAGQRAATKVLAALRSMGIEARNIVSLKDPKLIHRQQIKEFISWPNLK